MSLASPHAFALCQRGAEAALKREYARVAPGWAAGYQRPGVVTFRANDSVTPEVAVPSVFARLQGLSLGTVAELAALSAQVQALPSGLRLHVIERDLYRPDEEPPGFERGPLAREIEAHVRAALPGRFLPELPAQPGDLVLDVIVAPGDPWLLGLHRHAAGQCPFPGGRYPIQVPPEAPSRAFAKIEEAILSFELPVRAGDRALEIGASPGGAACALLRRGVSVIGVDPGAMDPEVLAFEGPARARLRHLQVPVAAIERAQLPADLDWLLLDVHLAPQVALRAARRVASWYRHSLLGAVLTLKLNDWAFAERTEAFLQQGRDMGLTSPRARQLASHRQELAVCGLTRRGEARKFGSPGADCT